MLKTDLIKIYSGEQSAGYAISLGLIAALSQIASGLLWLSYSWGALFWYYALFTELCLFLFVPTAVLGGGFTLGFETVLLSIFIFMTYKVKQTHH